MTISPSPLETEQLARLDGVIISEEAIVLQTIQRSLNGKQGND
jgi:hypothetical protein